MSTTPNNLQSQLILTITLSVAVLGLLVGSVTPDPRLSIHAIALSPIIFAVLAVAVVADQEAKKTMPKVLLLLAPLGLASVTLMWSADQGYGAFKFLNLIVVCLLVVPLFCGVIFRFGFEFFARGWLALMGALLIAAVLYKLANGFFDRTVPFLFNGPIVFARLMGISAVLGFLTMQTVPRKLLVSGVFTLAVFWTFSKGPIIALLVTLLICCTFMIPASQRRRILFALAGFLSISVLLFWDAIQDVDLGRLGLLLALFSGDYLSVLSEQASTNDRLLMFLSSASYVQSAPLGAGLGGWSSAVVVPGQFFYPHNLVLELLSECGWLLGSIAIVPFCYFCFSGNKEPLAVCLFLFAAQLVSGDILDARYLLVFSLLSICTSNQHSLRRAASSTPGRI